MISYTPEGRYIKLGLNFSLTPGGFRLLWAWYDFATHMATTYRLRIRLWRPQIMWAKNRFNVIDSYLMRHDLELVSREVLHDLKAIENSQKRINEPLAYVKPL